MADFIGAVDQGTTSTRFMIFNAKGGIVALDQKEHEQIYPRPGWVEHNPAEIWENTCQVIRGALDKAGISGSDLKAVGITNQRETTVVWDKTTGEPVCNAIVWQCTRTDEICKKLGEEQGPDRFRAATGLPLATYFSGPKLSWILDNVAGARQKAESGRLIFGTMETFIIWHLTGGAAGGSHVTDITNASRTLMMNLADLAWDGTILEAMNIPPAMLPEIKPSIDPETWGNTDKNGPLGAGVPVCGALGDQQAALVGQTCFSTGDAKNTYGTGCFLLLNTGNAPVASKHGLLTTAGYQVRGQAPVYCLEGSIAIAGALVQWLRDNLGLIKSAPEVETLAKTVDDNGGMYMVPAFSGLFAPYWRSDARGVMVGLTRYVNKGHMARAALEAVAHQAVDIAEAMEKDSGVGLTSLKVDGGMVKNQLLMQLQADLLNVPVIRPKVTETTALGAAYAAGLAAGFWPDMEALKQQWEQDVAFAPAMSDAERQTRCALWKKAVDRTLDWI